MQFPRLTFTFQAAIVKTVIKSNELNRVRATFLQVTFRPAFCSPPACQISDSTTNNTKRITWRKGWRTLRLKKGQENTCLLLKISKGFGDGSSRDDVVVVDLCLSAELAHRQAWRSVFAKCSHLWWTSCCPSPSHPTWLSPPASPEQHLQLWQWQKQAAGPSRFVLVDCWVVVFIGFEPASGGIVKTDRALARIDLPDTSPCKKRNKKKVSFLISSRNL